MKLYKLLKKDLGNKLYLLVFLILVSGVCNLFLLRAVSLLLAGKLSSSIALVAYVGGLGLFYAVSKYVSLEIVKIGLRTTRTIRTAIASKIADSSFMLFEKIGKERILSSLNHDTQTLTHAPVILTMILTSLSTIVVCFVYLAWLSVSLFGFLLLLLTVVLGIYLLMMKGVWK